MAISVVINSEVLRRRIPNLTLAARKLGVRPATLSNLYRGKTRVGHARLDTVLGLARLAGCSVEELLIVEDTAEEESFAESLLRWGRVGDGRGSLGAIEVENPRPERARASLVRKLPRSKVDDSLVPPDSPLEI